MADPVPGLAQARGSGVDPLAGRPERVWVPAGWYWALPVVEAEGWVNGVDDKGPFTAWYAPRVGLVKLTHRGRTIQELKSFRPAG